MTYLKFQTENNHSPTKNGPKEAAKTPLELAKTTFAEWLENFEAIPENKQKMVSTNHKKNIENLISDTKEIREMHNKENP